MYTDRLLRKPLDKNGIIHIKGCHLIVNIKNFSITGLLAEFDLADLSPEDINMYRTLPPSTRVDIYLPGLKLGGTAKITRSERTDAWINFALEFCSIEYKTENPVCSRRIHRKEMELPGQIFFNGIEHAFNTKNVSTDGLMILVAGKFDVIPGMTMPYAFDWFELFGEAQVIWGEQNDHSTLLGLRYLNDNQHGHRSDKQDKIPLIEENVVDLPNYTG